MLYYDPWWTLVFELALVWTCLEWFLKIYRNWGVKVDLNRKTKQTTSNLILILFRSISEGLDIYTDCYLYWFTF